MKNNTILTLILAIVIALGVYAYMANIANTTEPTPIVEEPIATTTQTPPTSQKISLQLEPTGLGGLKFGASEEEVLTTFNRALGSSTKDTGWVSSFSEYGTCPGKTVRVVEWNRLRVFFGDTTFGTKKFFQYEYTDRDTKNPTPLITTSEGLTLGATKAELLSLYPKAKITPWTENYAQYEKFTVNDSLFGTLQNGKVFWINAGVQCGE